jgi:hypothetical protein
MKRIAGRIFLAALLVCGAVHCHAQFSRPVMPLGNQPPVNPADPTGSAASIPPDPAVERAMLKQRRIEAFMKMHADARKLGQLAAELNAELDPVGDAARKAGPQKTAQDALNNARKIDKLAGEIDRLMRTD